MKSKPLIFTTPNCVYCKMTKGFFKTHGIEYDEKDVSADQNAAIEMIEKSGQRGVPVIQVGDQIVVGFDQPALEQLLGL